MSYDNTCRLTELMNYLCTHLPNVQYRPSRSYYQYLGFITLTANIRLIQLPTRTHRGRQ